MTTARKFGLDFVGHIPWGTHLCQFYETKHDLIDILVPYFTEGLRSNEACVWVTSEPLKEEEAATALENVLPDITQFIEKGQLFILPYTEVHMKGGTFDADRVMQWWLDKEQEALDRGFEGLRLAGNTFWIARYLWDTFTDYEETVNNGLEGHRIIAVCPYSLEKCSGSDIADVIRNHGGTIIKRGVTWSVVEDVVHRKEVEIALQRAHDELEQTVEKRTRELQEEIEERKQAEVEIARRSEMLNLAHDAVIIRDINDRITYWNKGAERLYGWKEEAVRDKVTHEQFQTVFPEPLHVIMQSLYRDGNWEGELIHTTADNALIVVESRWTLYRDSDGKSLAIFEINKDITVRKQAEEELQQAHEEVQTLNKELQSTNEQLRFTNETLEERVKERTVELQNEIKEHKVVEEELQSASAEVHAASLYSRNLIETSLDPLVTINAEGKITDVNKATEEVTGLSREELIGTDFNNYFTEPEKARRVYQHAFTEGFVRDYPLAIRHTSGRVTDVLYHATAYRDEAGDIQGVFATAWDITELKRAEENLRRAHDELEQIVQERTRDLQEEIEEHKVTEEELRRSNKELEQFAYVASHDLQEPLRTVTSSLGLIESWYKNKLGAEADTFITYAVDGAKQMQQLIKDLLEYSRVTTRGEVFAPVHCEDVVQSAIENLKVSIEESEVKITLPDKPLPTVVGDKTQLTQLFQNLIGNAIKFRSEQLPEVQIDVGLDGVGNTWQFSIKDNGIGMDMEYADKIFTIFQRLHTTEQYKGTGVGLALCKKIIERHNGEIWVDSKQGKGSTFYFTLPFYGE